MDVASAGRAGSSGPRSSRRCTGDGHRVLRLQRGGVTDGDDIGWDPDAGRIDAPALEGVDAVVHLAGEGIGEQRWTDEQKQPHPREPRARARRCSPARSRAASASRSVFVSGSAIGYYGNRGDEVLTEDSAPGDDFLAGVVQAWEAETQPAVDAGVRTVHIRTGIVLAAARRRAEADAAAVQARPRRQAGFGQAVDELDRARRRGRRDPARDRRRALRGPVNLTAPNPVTNAEFAHTLGGVLHRPTVLPTPMFPLKRVYGAELVESLLLASQRGQARRASRQRASRSGTRRWKPACAAMLAALKCASGSTPTSATIPTTRSRLLCAAAHPDVDLVGVSTVDGDVERRAELARDAAPRRRRDRRPPPPGRALATVDVLAAASGRGRTLPSSPTRGRLPRRVGAMGGALRPVNHRGELRVVEHNVGRDPDAARAAARASSSRQISSSSARRHRNDRVHSRRGARARARRTRASSRCWLAGDGRRAMSRSCLHDPLRVARVGRRTGHRDPATVALSVASNGVMRSHGALARHRRRRRTVWHAIVTSAACSALLG